ncbi:unnamed protein product [Closterium sp. NIES-53]
MITSLAKHEVATGLDIKPSTGTNLLCVSCIGGKLARHTFPKKNSHAEEALAVLHIDLCGPFWVAIKVVSLYFLLLKDCHTRFVWVKPGAKKSDVLREFEKWLPLVERHTKKSVLMLCSNRGGEFLGKEFTAFVDEKGIVHDLTSPCTPRQNGMAEREMRTVVEAVDSTAGDDAVPIADQEEARPYVGEGVGLHGAVHDLRAPTRWEVAMAIEVIFYETLSQEVWKAKYGPASARTQAHPPTDTSAVPFVLLAEVDEPADEDVEDVLLPPPPLVLVTPPHLANDLPSTRLSASGNEGRSEASPVVPASGIAEGRRDAKLVDEGVKWSSTGAQ